MPARRREAFLAACALDVAAGRTLGDEAALVGMAERAVPEGPSWEGGLALGARLTGAWLEEAARATAAARRGSTRGRGRVRG